jgi:hypothetical protein
MKIFVSTLKKIKTFLSFLLVHTEKKAVVLYSTNLLTWDLRIEDTRYFNSEAHIIFS